MEALSALMHVGSGVDDEARIKEMVNLALKKTSAVVEEVTCSAISESIILEGVVSSGDIPARSGSPSEFFDECAFCDAPVSPSKKQKSRQY